MTKEICPIVSDFDNEISYVSPEARIKSGGRLSTKKLGTKISNMEYWRFKSRNTLWRRHSNIQDLGGKIQHKSDPKTHRQAKQWHDIVKGPLAQGAKFLKTHRSEDLETALKALEIAGGSFEEVAERYE